MLIRTAKVEDAMAIGGFIVMAESEMAHHFTGTTDPEASARALVDFVLNPVPNRYSLANNLVAEVDGRVGGAIMSFPADRQPQLDTVLLAALNRRGYNLEKLFFEGEPGTYYLSTMGVCPELRGRGIGSTLLTAAEAAGAKQGFARASLLVSKGKEKAKKLYERLGYRVTTEVAIADVGYFRMLKDLPKQ